MNIFNSIIKDEEIIGISALMQKTRGSFGEEVWYSFSVITKSNTQEINGPVVQYFAGNMDKADQERMKNFRTGYFQVKEKIATLLGEQVEEFKPHTQILSEVFDEITTIKGLLHQQFAEMRTKSKEPVLQRVKELFCHIETLKEISLK